MSEADVTIKPDPDSTPGAHPGTQNSRLFDQPEPEADE